jgi:hypothetical protein
VAVSPDGARIVTGSDDKTARVWDAKRGLLALGFVLVGFASHPNGSKEKTEEAPAASEPMPDERERVVDWVREFRRRTGRSPRIPEVQQAFGLKRTTAWRRIEQAR